ncbi:MAG: hypothetical protein JRH06_16935 [Deltaproteobacteria bacterium]|nr:hypothetical protein [Deltaproteobacteria bacterium]
MLAGDGRDEAIRNPFDYASFTADVNGDSEVGLQEAIYGLQCVAGLRGIEIMDYFPLNDGDSWTYDNNGTLDSERKKGSDPFFR